MFNSLQPHGLYSLSGSSVHGILQARILEWVAMPSSRGIFPTQGLNLGLLLCRQILYPLSHQSRGMDTIQFIAVTYLWVLSIVTVTFSERGAVFYHRHAYLLLFLALSKDLESSDD